MNNMSNTIVVKSSDFSYSMIRQLEHTDKEINVKIVLVNPWGETSTVITNESIFREMIETSNTIIYDK